MLVLRCIARNGHPWHMPKHLDQPEPRWTQEGATLFRQSDRMNASAPGRRRKACTLGRAERAASHLVRLAGTSLISFEVHIAATCLRWCREFQYAVHHPPITAR